MTPWLSFNFSIWPKDQMLRTKQTQMPNGFKERNLNQRIGHIWKDSNQPENWQNRSKRRWVHQGGRQKKWQQKNHCLNYLHFDPFYKVMATTTKVKEGNGLVWGKVDWPTLRASGGQKARQGSRWGDKESGLEQMLTGSISKASFDHIGDTETNLFQLFFQVCRVFTRSKSGKLVLLLVFLSLLARF